MDGGEISPLNTRVKRTWTHSHGACDLALLEVERHMSEDTSHVDRRGNEDGRMDTNRTANKPEIGERKGTLQKGGNNRYHDSPESPESPPKSPESPLKLPKSPLIMQFSA